MSRTAAINPGAIESLLLAITAVGILRVPFAPEYPSLGPVAGLVLALLAIVRGHLARGEIKRSGGELRGGWLAALGGWAGAFILLGYCMMPGYGTRGPARRSQSINNLKQIGLAFHNYHDAYGRFPPAVVYAPDGRPLYSWRVVILPFLEQQALYERFHLDEPWDSPHNGSLLAQGPGTYAWPAGLDAPRSPTRYLAFVGPGTAFDDPRGQPLATFTDGTAQTVMVVEAAEPVPWSRPVDLACSPVGQLPKLGSPYLTGGKVNGFNALFADGSTRFVRDTVPEPDLRSLITRDGSEIIGHGDFDSIR